MQNEQFRKLLSAYPSKAIQFLYEHYYHALIRVALKYTGDLKASQDIIQETFLHVWENHKKLGEFHQASIEFYLLKVAKYKAISYFKQTKRTSKQNIAFLNTSEIDNPIESKIIELEKKQELYTIIATFPTRERQCLVLKLSDGLSTDEIAQKLNVTRKAVERSLTSGNKRLRRIYASKVN